MPITLAKKTLPKYAQLIDKLKDDIARGSLGPGDRLPSFSQLQRDFGATTTTVERVFSSLERDGLIERHHGKGTFVRHQPVCKPAIAQRSGLMDRAVIVLSESLETQEDRHQPGWSSFVMRGTTEAIKSACLHAFAITPYKTAKEIIGEIIEASPYGVILPDKGGSQRGDLLLIAHSVFEAGIAVSAYRAGDELAELDRVVADYVQGSYDLTRWLIQRGRKRILNVWPGSNIGYWYAPRYEGYKKAMLEAGLEPLPIVYAPYPTQTPDEQETHDSVRNVAGRLIEYMSGSASVDAIMLVSDGYSSETAAMLNLFGKIPNVDVDIVGYDNYWQEMESFYLPLVMPIATIDKNNILTGEALVKLLIERKEGLLSQGPQQRTIAQTLVEIAAIE